MVEEELRDENRPQPPAVRPEKAAARPAPRPRKKAPAGQPTISSFFGKK